MKRNLVKIVAATVLLFASFTYPVSYYGSQRVVTVDVVSTEFVNSQSNQGHYLVFCKNRVLMNGDSWLYWKFNSSDMYSKLSTAGRYRFVIAGWRIPFLSMYPNIVGVEKL